LRCFDAARSVIQNIEDLLLSEHAPLYAEPGFLLREELREVEKYYAILRALAPGSLPSRTITEPTGLADRSLRLFVQDRIKSLSSATGVRIHSLADLYAK